MKAVYPNLKVEMVRKGLLGKDLASFLGVTQNTLTNKLNGRSEFTLPEAKKIHSEYFKDIASEYLFERREITR